MKPNECDYASHVAYTRALEESYAAKAVEVELLRGYIKAYADATGEAWAKEALAATADLQDLRLCYAKPVGVFDIHNGDSYIQIKPEYADEESVKLYRAWEPKP